ncbi:MAG: CBS domain-containing protein [Microthrixaceae bacterium]|nr:CBS domain-containing protein [Microthrixaceae bacterium]
MQVSDILRHKGAAVTTVSPGATLEDAARLLDEHRIGALVVSVDGRTVDGILSERDIVTHIAAVGGAALLSSVADVMTREVHPCAPGDALEQVMSVMTESRVRHLPVMVDGTLSGIVSIGDAVARRLNELETESAQMLDYIQTGRT